MLNYMSSPSSLVLDGWFIGCFFLVQVGFFLAGRLVLRWKLTMAGVNQQHFRWMRKRWMFAVGPELFVWTCWHFVCWPRWFASYFDILVDGTFFEKDKLSKHYVFEAVWRLLTLFFSPPKNVQFCKDFLLCFFMMMKPDQGDVFFKEIFLLGVSSSAGKTFLVTVCQGQQSLPLAF